MSVEKHTYYMRLALQQAGRAAEAHEVPVGALLVDAEGGVLAADHNRTITCLDPTAHAEMLVLRAAAQRIGNYRLLQTTLYATIEPCVMCMGAVIHARVAAVVYGAPDLRWGAAGSLYDFAADRRLNHHPEVIADVEREACADLIRAFMRARR